MAQEGTTTQAREVSRDLDRLHSRIKLGLHCQPASATPVLRSIDWRVSGRARLERANVATEHPDLEGTLEKKVSLNYRRGDIVDAGVVISGVHAECLKRVIDGNVSRGREHAFGLLDDEPGVQRLLQLFGGALMLPCG
jgi:hypothetical protein